MKTIIYPIKLFIAFAQPMWSYSCVFFWI